MIAGTVLALGLYTTGCSITGITRPETGQQLIEFAGNHTFNDGNGTIVDGIAIDQMNGVNVNGFLDVQRNSDMPDNPISGYGEGRVNVPIYQNLLLTADYRLKANEDFDIDDTIKLGPTVNYNIGDLKGTASLYLVSYGHDKREELRLTAAYPLTEDLTVAGVSKLFNEDDGVSYFLKPMAKYDLGDGFFIYTDAIITGDLFGDEERKDTVGFGFGKRF